MNCSKIFTLHIKLNDDINSKFSHCVKQSFIQDIAPMDNNCLEQYIANKIRYKDMHPFLDNDYQKCLE